MRRSDPRKFGVATFLVTAVTVLAGNARAQGPAPPAPVQPAAPSPAQPAISPAAQLPGNSPSSAEPLPPTGGAESADVGDAREAFRLGSALAKQGQWLDALGAFERSARLKTHPITTYNVAYCQRALGHFAAAYQSFSVALAVAAAPDAPKLPPDLETQAKGYLVEMEQRVSRVHVTLVEADMSMRVDGYPVEAIHLAGDRTIFVAATEASLNVPAPPSAFDLWLDPGTHVFVASRAGGASVVESHAFAVGEAAALEFPTQPAAPVPAPAARAPTPAPGGEVVAEHGPNRTAAFVAFGLGAAGFVSAAVFAGVSLNDKSLLKSDPRCSGTTCPPDDAGKETNARRFADFATVGVTVGAVGAVLGTYLWFSAKPSHEGPPPSTAQIEPWVGLGSAGVAGKF